MSSDSITAMVKLHKATVFPENPNADICIISIQKSQRMWEMTG